MEDAMQSINEDIKNQNYKPVYLLYGEEDYLKRTYRDKLTVDMPTLSDNSFNDIFLSAITLSNLNIIDILPSYSISSNSFCSLNPSSSNTLKIYKSNPTCKTAPSINTKSLENDKI